MMDRRQSLALALIVAGWTGSARAQRVAPADRFPYQAGVDVQHYGIDITVGPRGADVRAEATISLQRDLSVDTLRLDLVGMHVDGVAVNGIARTARVDSLSVGVPLRARDGTRVTVRVRYHGAPRDGLIVREDSLRGWSAFGDNWPNRARFWIPSVDHPSDKATVGWRVTAPSRLAVIANGTRVSRQALTRTAIRSRGLIEDLDGGWTTTTFRMTQPIPTYLMVIGVAAMQETSLGNTACHAIPQAPCVPQSVWTFAPETPSMPGTFAEAGRIVSTFTQWVGPFAYDRLSHVQSATRFGGMENATAIFYADQAFRDHNVGVGLIAHETAHQWFGDAVTPRRWQDLWLSEGFATYFAALYTQRSRGDSAFHAELRRMRDQVIAAPVVAQRPVVDTIGAETPLTLLNANSYQKGGFVLHMLRTKLGDRAFFAALRAYQRRYRNGTATTDMLRHEFEVASGIPLSAFFTQWLHQPGWAELSVTWTFKPEQHALVLQVVQSDRFRPRAMRLALRLRDAQGRDRDVQVALTADVSQMISVPLTDLSDVAALVADPNVELLANVELLHAMR